MVGLGGSLELGVRVHSSSPPSSSSPSSSSPSSSSPSSPSSPSPSSSSPSSSSPSSPSSPSSSSPKSSSSSSTFSSSSSALAFLALESSPFSSAVRLAGVLIVDDGEITCEVDDQVSSVDATFVVRDESGGSA